MLKYLNMLGWGHTLLGGAGTAMGTLMLLHDDAVNAERA